MIRNSPDARSFSSLLLLCLNGIIINIDFEGYATISRAGNNGISCGCFGGSGNSDDKKEKTILIKGAFCFVFVKETDPSPKYAISLAHTKTTLHPSSSSSPCRVTIETSLGDVEWELEFENKKLANQFTNAFRQQAAIGEADEARKVTFIFPIFSGIKYGVAPPSSPLLLNSRENTFCSTIFFFQFILLVSGNNSNSVLDTVNFSTSVNL